MEKERGNLERNFFSHHRGCTFLGPPFGNMQGMFLKVKLTNSIFKHSPKDRGKHLLIVSRFINCISFLLRSNDCSTSTPLMLSWAWQKGQGCFFLQLSLFLWGRVLRMFIFSDWRCMFLFVFMLGSKLTASYIFFWMQLEYVTSASQLDPNILCPSSLRFWFGQIILLKFLPPRIIESHISYRT